jgi:Fe-S-cluster containining protein
VLIADLQRWTGLHLQPVSFQVEIDGQLQAPVRLCDVPDLRQLLGEFLLELVEQQQRDWFASSCGQCGNSCRRPDILVREQEIFALQMHLGITQSQFVQTYLEPASTWNAGDGHLRHTPDGACPFLLGQGSEPGSSHCSIHEIRPRSCQEFLSNKNYCRKDPGQLLELLSDCWVRPDQITVFRKGGGHHTVTTSEGLWARLGEALKATAQPQERRVSAVLESLCDILDQESAQIDPDYNYSPVLGRIHALLRQAASMMDSDWDRDQKIEAAWNRYRQFEARLQGEVVPLPAARPQRPLLRPPQAWSGLRLQEDGLSVDGSEELLPARLGQPFLQTLLALAHDELQLALRPAEPPCYLCGECCRQYVVEIHPSDMQRLSQHLQLPLQEFIQRYTSPARFGWNLRDRVLNKQSVPTYSKKLLELTLVGEHGDQQCVFLERRQDGLFYCQVHSHKPQVCRGYEPTHSLCRQTNQRENAGRQADRLHGVEILPDTIRVETRERELQLERCDHPELQRAACQLEEAVRAHLSR